MRGEIRCMEVWPELVLVKEQVWIHAMLKILNAKNAKH